MSEPGQWKMGQLDFSPASTRETFERIRLTIPGLDDFETYYPDHASEETLKSCRCLPCRIHWRLMEDFVDYRRKFS